MKIEVKVTGGQLKILKALREGRRVHWRQGLTVGKPNLVEKKLCYYKDTDYHSQLYLTDFGKLAKLTSS